MSCLFGKWLSMNSRLEDLQQYSQIKRTSYPMRKQQRHSFALMCIFQVSLCSRLCLSL